MSIKTQWAWAIEISLLTFLLLKKNKMVKIFACLMNVTTGRQLYKYLLRECKRLPSPASEHYSHSVKQSFKQHLDETNSERIKEIIERALEDAEWVLKKYNLRKL